MTTTASEQAAFPSEIWDVLLGSFAAKARPGAVSANSLAVPRPSLCRGHRESKPQDPAPSGT